MMDDWYASLAKPPWTPPAWVFGPAWTVLYCMIAVAGWRLLQRCRAMPRGARLALALFAVQLGLNLLWTPVFFGMRSPGLALVVIFPLLAAILACIWASWKVCRASALLLMPYLAWVAFASCLNAAIWWMN